MVNRIDPNEVKNILTDDEAPSYNTTVSGYGSKIPTRYRVELHNGGIRRVYMMQYGNSGSPYIIVNGVEHFVSNILP